MGSHAKNNQQSSTPAATPTGVAGPMTTAKMTPQLQRNPVSDVPIRNLVPGVGDAGPKLPGMAAGFDSHGLPVQQPVQQQYNPRNLLAEAIARGGHDGGGYTTSGSGWSGNSSANSGYGMGGRHW